MANESGVLVVEDAASALETRPGDPHNPGDSHNPSDSHNPGDPSRPAVIAPAFRSRLVDTRLVRLVQKVRLKLVRWGVGRLLISAALMVTLAAIFVANMPDSVIKTTLLTRAQPYLTVLGLGEDWGVFAPNPRSQVIYATGRITYSDGTTSVWSFPIRPGIMSYSDYRWQKFEEHVRLDDFSGLWKPFAQYLLAHEAVPGKTPVQVALMRRWAQIEPPGISPALSPWSQYVYFVMPVGGAR